MKVRINPHHFCATVKIPASKSHTIRQLLIASLADGVSEIKNPLDSLDTRSCVSACRAFGAQIIEHRTAAPQPGFPLDPANPTPPDENGEKLVCWKIKGNNNFKNLHSLLPSPQSPLPIIDVGNSGTTLYLALAVAALQTEAVQFTGDEQIKRRGAAPLLDALVGLGAYCESNNGCAPITIKGPWKGGKVSLSCPTSQYLSALLIASPLAPAGVVTEIEVPLLNEKPYIKMTLSYLRANGIAFQTNPDFSHFVIPGGSSWKALSSSVPADFSSAAFPAAAAAITGGPVTLLGLDPQDTQGDKFFLKMLESMGCEVKWSENDSEALSPLLTISRKSPLRGGTVKQSCTFDLNETPDLLPAAAVTAAYAQGDTALVNVAHARIKETDRITVMAEELAKLGVKCTQRPDGLIIHGKGTLFNETELSPTQLLPVIDSRGDHRIVMAFAAAALGSSVPVEISGAESAAVTYPGFLDLLGAQWIN